MPVLNYQNLYLAPRLNGIKQFLNHSKQFLNFVLYRSASEQSRINHDY